MPPHDKAFLCASNESTKLTMISLPERHFRQTAKLVKAIPKVKIAYWLLNEGYFPEQYVLPPSFQVSDFDLNTKPYNKKISDLARRQLLTISYPKSMLSSRVFSLQHPWNYHDIVFYMMNDWELILDHLFYDKLKIFSYSFPIPVNAKNEGEIGDLRSGRMIYEWIEMAENDMIAAAFRYKCLIRTDITNFYNSVYTHSIGWALHGREESFADKSFKLTGHKIDKLIQYSNDAKSNGIPIGSALSDLIAEIVLAKIDLEVSEKLKDIDFLGSRFKDDYRIYCNKESDAKTILKVLTDELNNFNLLINESKTKVLTLPEGLYRSHDREYHLYSLKGFDSIPFKTFELTLMKTLDIHRTYPGTSILEKFLSELFDADHNLKIQFSPDKSTRNKQISKAFSLMILLKRESEKVISQVLAVIEAVYDKYNSKNRLRDELRNLISSEISMASDCKSIFDLSWLVFFSRYKGLGLKGFTKTISADCLKHPILSTLLNSSQKIFNDSGITLFLKPKDCGYMKLAKRFAVFNREEP